MSNLSYPQAQLIESFDCLSQQLQLLASALRESSLPLWVPLTEAEESQQLTAREKAVQLYCDIWYRDDGDGRKTRSCHGLIAADQAILDRCERVNEAKQQFQQAIKQIRNEPQQLEWIKDLNSRNEQLRQDLNIKGLSRLHLKQCYRQIPTSNQHPYRVGFNWYSSGRSIKKIDAAEVLERLAKLGEDKPHIQVQIELLKQLKGDTPLAQVQQQAPLMRANLRFSDAVSTEARNAMNLSLPLLFKWEPSKPFPEYNQPPLQPPQGRIRQVRSDCKIEETAFIPTLRVHRYLR